MNQADADVASRAAAWPQYQKREIIDPPIGPGDRPVLSASFDPLTTQKRPAWMVVSHEEWGLDETAEDSLGRIGRAAVPALMGSLQSPDPVLRLRAIKILGRIGPDAEAAVPKLVVSLQDPSQIVRKAAARTLGQIGPAASDAVGPLLQVMDEAPPTPGLVRPASLSE